MASNRKFRTTDVGRLYKHAYNVKFDWEDIMPPNFLYLMQVYRKARTCPIELSFSSMLAMTSCLAGPQAKVSTHPHSKPSSLNLYMLAVCAPGGGKSSTFDHFIRPGEKVFQEDRGRSPVIESYTHAGLQEHMISLDGYAIIASEEGGRILQGIQAKQAKMEGERQFLCKSWGGTGDSTTLRDKDRGYTSTSLCMLLMIQPQTLINEMRFFEEGDGFMDRFDLVTSQPQRHKSEILQQFSAILEHRFPNTVYDIYMAVYHIHKDEEVVYYFSNQAQKLFDQLADDDVEDFNRMYDTGMSVKNGNVGKNYAMQLLMII